MLVARGDRGPRRLEPRRRLRSFFAARPAALVVGASALAGVVAAVVAYALDMDLLTCRGLAGMIGVAAALVSLGCGVLLGTLTIGLTPGVVRRWHWAIALHSALRPAVRDAGDGAIFVIAVTTAAGEELMFRGLLVPLLGVAGSSLLFGALHQVRGQGRWGWMLWATVMGFFFAVIYKVTGNLAGPLVAHAAINVNNLRFLRDHDPQPPSRALGGLLGGREQ